MLELIEVTQSARDYLKSLIDASEKEDMSIRVFITQPGTPYAETCVAYCEKDAQKDTDLLINLPEFKLWIDNISRSFLENAKVDYIQERMGGTLTIKAPNAKLPQLRDDSTLAEKVNYHIQTTISPNLASHGGFVSLVGIVEESVAVLEFGGGCQGCSAVSITLKDGIERQLIQLVPELTEVRDTTDHSMKHNAYYS